MNLSGSLLKPGALIYINQGAPKIPINVIITSIIANKVATLFINKSTSLLDFLALYSARIGIKAWVNAPSAEILLNKFGILNATKKASVATPTPKVAAIILSLKKPRILDKVVIPLTLASVLDIFIKDYSIR
jgi:hypothetical protein